MRQPLQPFPKLISSYYSSLKPWVYLTRAAMVGVVVGLAFSSLEATGTNPNEIARVLWLGLAMGSSVTALINSAVYLHQASNFLNAVNPMIGEPFDDSNQRCIDIASWVSLAFLGASCCFSAGFGIAFLKTAIDWGSKSTVLASVGGGLGALAFAGFEAAVCKFGSLDISSVIRNPIEGL